jgi:hypothetical protein
MTWMSLVIDNVASLIRYETGLELTIWLYMKILLCTHTLSSVPVSYRPNEASSSTTAKEI